MPVPPSPPKFLIIDDNADSRTFLVKTLLRKYADAVVQECQNGDSAVAAVRNERLTAVVAHRTFEYDGETLIRLLRQAGPDVPLVMISGYDRRGAAHAAGADAFMNYDAWLTAGAVVAEAIAAREQASRAKADETTVRAEPEVV